MSRRVSNHQPRFARQEHNPYQVTTLSPIKRQPTTYPHHVQKRSHRKTSARLPPQTTIDIGFSDATTTDTCYDYCTQDSVSFQHSALRESRNTDVSFSEDSGSTRLPYYEFDDESNRGCSRNSFSERSFRQAERYRAHERIGRREELEEDEELWEDRLYHEIQTPCDNSSLPPVNNLSNSRRITTASRLSDRPQSSMSSALTNAMVYGCGGRCQTFESVCYFILQLFFTMGILIGVSLCIAGLVLRKSAARNLQVLVYIGIMLALVSILLLTVQCRAKNTARRRIKAIQSAKRAPIPMETLNIRPNPIATLERLPSIRENQRLNQLPQVHNVAVRPLPQRPQRIMDHRGIINEEQGIPWWRRRDAFPS